MSKIILPGGTDVAEMALFSVDALSPKFVPDPVALASMETQGLVMRFPTGSDGGYLLHVYLDEPIPADVMKYCVAGEAKKGVLNFEHGRLGFGGMESLSATFTPDGLIRTDARIPPGKYEATAYLTEYPDELIAAAIEAKIGGKSLRVLALPGCVTPVGVLLAAIALAAEAWYLAAFVAAAFFGLRFLFVRSRRLKRLRDQKLSVEMEYPSIVVHMVSNARSRTSVVPEADLE